MTMSSNIFDEFVMNGHSFFVVQNIDALRFHFQNDFDVHANIWKEFSWGIFFMLNSMFETIILNHMITHDYNAYTLFL